jgi:hypothetical protein
MMGRPFRRTRAGVKVSLQVQERALLARLLEDVEGLLEQDAVERGAAVGEPSADTSNTATRRGTDDDVLAGLEASLTAPPPTDPAVARLLPEGNRDDPDLAAGYRRLTEDGLRERKRAGLERASAALVRPDPVVLDPAEAQALLKGLTDVRLVLAERLGVQTDEDAELLHHALARSDDLADPRMAAAALYDALTWWQEALISTLR